MENGYRNLMNTVSPMRHALDHILHKMRDWTDAFANTINDTDPEGCGERRCQKKGRCVAYGSLNEMFVRRKDACSEFVYRLEYELEQLDIWTSRVQERLERLHDFTTAGENTDTTEDIKSTHDVDALFSYNVDEMGAEDWISTASSIEAPEAVRPIEGFLQLPVELLTRILLYAAEDDKSVGKTFSCLNSFLRTLSISIPGLWSHLDNMDGPSMVRVHLDRSRTTLLGVRLWIPPVTGIDDGVKDIETFCQLVAPHISRIRWVDIELFRPQWIRAVVPWLESGKWIDLEFFGLRLTDTAVNGHRNIPVATKVPCKARKLHLQKIDPGYNPLPVVFGDTVRDLQISGIHEDVVVRGLRHMPALERVRLEDLTREMIFFEDEEPFTDFTLEHLNRAEFIRSFPAYALRRLKAPNLESFIFHYALSGESPGPAEALPVFLAAAPLLRDLEILRLEVRWKWWRDVLPHLASLRRLRLLGTNARQRHLGLLIWGEESHDPEAVPSYHCPNLEELVLDNELLLTSTIVRRIIKSRTSPGGDCSVIRSITMRGCAPESVRGNDVREIRNLVDHFVLGVLDTRSVERDLDESSSSSDGDTASEDWELASGDVEVIQGRVLRN